MSRRVGLNIRFVGLTEHPIIMKYFEWLEWILGIPYVMRIWPVQTYRTSQCHKYYSTLQTLLAVPSSSEYKVR